MTIDDETDILKRSETNLSHFIPSVQLKGSRGQKLDTLDRLIRYLERLRRSLAGDTTEIHAGFERPSQHAADPAWPWFVAGTLLSALFLVLMLTARSCA